MHVHVSSVETQSAAMADDRTGKIAIPRLETPSFYAKQSKKRKTNSSKRESKRQLDNKRNKTRINIGVAFQRWREVRDIISLKLDSELAVLLLDR